MTLLEEIYSLYDRYTAHEITEAIKQYRQEFVIDTEVKQIDDKIIELKTRRKKLKPNEFIPD